MKLTKLRRDFVIHYCTPGQEGFHNALRAALKAGYKTSTAKSNIYGILQDPDIRRIIKTNEAAAHRALHSSAMRAIELKQRRAFFDPADFFEEREIAVSGPLGSYSKTMIALKPLDKMTAEQRMCIDGIDVKGSNASTPVYVMPDRARELNDIIKIDGELSKSAAGDSWEETREIIMERVTVRESRRAAVPADLESEIVDRPGGGRLMFSPDETLRYADAFLKYNDEPVEFDPWQEMFLKDRSRFSILLKGRQEGFSFAVAAKKFIELQSAGIKNRTVQFVSYNLMDAVDKIRYVSFMAHGIPERHRKKIAYETKTGIEFLDAGGRTTSRLLSIACRPPRGKPGDVVLDEFAIYGPARQRLIYTAALPSITRGGTITIGSTPLGKLGLFHDIYTDRANYENYTRFTVPWWQSGALCRDIAGARAAGVREMDTEDRVRLLGTEVLQSEFAAFDLESFRQEFECSFLDAAGSYIGLDLIYANTPGMREGDRNRELADGEDEDETLEITAFKTADELITGYEEDRDGVLYLGYDVARTRDLAVIYVIGLLPDGRKKSLARIEMAGQTFEFQRDQIRKIMKSGLPVSRGCIDATGVGMDTAETLQREFSSAVIEGVVFGVRSKDVLARGVKEGLEKREFLLENDRKFHRQIQSIKQFSLPGGGFRYDAERDETGHADGFWAWALANYAIPKAGARKGFYRQYRERRAAASDGATTEHAGRRGKSLSPALREWEITG